MLYWSEFNTEFDLEWELGRERGCDIYLLSQLWVDSSPQL